MRASGRDKVLTAFRLTKVAIDNLIELREKINQNTVIKLSRADIVELLIRQANPNNMAKKIKKLEESN